MVAWEYLFLSANGRVQGRPDELGAEGWEIVALHVEQCRYECDGFRGHEPWGR